MERGGFAVSCICAVRVLAQADGIPGYAGTPLPGVHVKDESDMASPEPCTPKSRFPFWMCQVALDVDRPATRRRIRILVLDQAFVHPGTGRDR